MSASPSLPGVLVVDDDPQVRNLLGLALPLSLRFLFEVHIPISGLSAIIAIADSIVSQLRSGILSSAILRTCARVTFPILLLFG